MKRACPDKKRYTSSAIALNNFGVVLVERRCYREAMRVFGDSLRVFLADPTMPLLLASLRKSLAKEINDSISSLSFAEVEHKIYRATLLLSDSNESDHPPALVALNDEESESECHDISPFLVPDGKTSVRNQYGEVMNWDPRLSCHRTNDYIVYFQQQRHEDECPNTSYAQLLSSILHNKGQTLRLLSQLSQPLRVSERLLDQALKWLALSQEAAEQRVIFTNHRHGPTTTPVTPRPKLTSLPPLKTGMNTLKTKEDPIWMTPLQTPKRKLRHFLLRSPAA